MKIYYSIYLVLLVSILYCNAAQHNDAVLLENVKAITLEAGKYTTGRRNSPIPQLQCVGGSDRCTHIPELIQCYNKGSDGDDIQWKCEAQLPTGIELGKIAVSCEGYSYPEDPYILKGSCGLEYELINSRSTNNYYYSSNQNTYSTKSSGYSWVFVVIGVVLFGVFIYFIVSRYSYTSSYAIDPPASSGSIWNSIINLFSLYSLYNLISSWWDRPSYSTYSNYYKSYVNRPSTTYRSSTYRPTTSYRPSTTSYRPSTSYRSSYSSSSSSSKSTSYGSTKRR